ncbi:MAG TPA: VWA domain-containing protein, partial [Thermoanaerobaculia bacterium]
MSRRRISLPACTLAVLAAVTLAAAQEAPSSDVFLDTVDVDVVNLEVVVTDDRGNPVRGLTRDDFVVLEDGERVELSNFFSVEDGTRRDAVAPAGEVPLLAAEGEAEEAPLDEEQRLSLAVVIDNSNLDPGSRKRILDQLREHLTAVLRPGDRVLIASLQPAVEVHQGFTDDQAAIDAALDGIGRSVAGRADLFSQRRMISSAIASLDGTGSGLGAISGGVGGPESVDTPEDGADRVLQLIRSYAAQADAVMRQTFGGIETVTSSLAGLPGRRGVLLVSEHLATNPAEGLLQEWYDSFSLAVPGL